LCKGSVNIWQDKTNKEKSEKKEEKQKTFAYTLRNINDIHYLCTINTEKMPITSLRWLMKGITNSILKYKQHNNEQY